MVEKYPVINRVRRLRLVHLSVQDTFTRSTSEQSDDVPLQSIWNIHVVTGTRYRPLSRRLDRCDRVIHNESGDPNGGNMCSFSGATCTSRVRHNADYVPYANIRFDL